MPHVTLEQISVAILRSASPKGCCNNTRTLANLATQRQIPIFVRIEWDELDGIKIIRAARQVLQIRVVLIETNSVPLPKRADYDTNAIMPTETILQSQTFSIKDRQNRVFITSTFRDMKADRTNHPLHQIIFIT